MFDYTCMILIWIEVFKNISDAPVDILDEKTASAVNILQQIISMQNQVRICSNNKYVIIRNFICLYKT